MSRLNTMYPDDEFLKNISNIMGKIDSKNETHIKQEIEQIGYKEFYRYYKEKDVYIKQLQQENQQLKETIKNQTIELNRLNEEQCNTRYNQLKRKYKQLKEEIEKYKFMMQARKDKYECKLNLYKSVIDEIWDFIKSYPGIAQSGVMTVKEILDKANIKESD